MKIIHTADWHVGHELYSYRREEEFDCFFRQLAELMQAGQPDALLVSGDVYDSYMPSNSAVRQLNQALLLLHDASPETEIILTAGNHDSGARLEAAAAPWASHRVHFIGSIDEHSEYNFIPIGEKGLVVALPFCYPANFPHHDSDPSEGRQERFFGRVCAYLQGETLPTVLMAHLYVQGARLNGGRQPRDIVGGSEPMSLDAISTGYDYLALGHIHRYQEITQRAFYSGSPLPISFDEPATHGVVIVELERGKAPKTDFRSFDIMRPLVTLPKGGAVPFPEALKQLAAMDPERECYIRLHVLADESLPFEHMEQATKALAGKRARYCSLKVEYPMRTEETGDSRPELHPEDFADYSARAIAEQFFRDEGLPEEEQKELLQLFDRIDATYETLEL